MVAAIDLILKKYPVSIWTQDCLHVVMKRGETSPGLGKFKSKFYQDI